MLLPRSLTKPTIRYLWGKVATLLWPTMVWLAIYALIVLPATNRRHPLAWAAENRGRFKVSAYRCAL